MSDSFEFIMKVFYSVPLAPCSDPYVKISLRKGSRTAVSYQTKTKKRVWTSLVHTHHNLYTESIFETLAMPRPFPELPHMV